MTFSPSVTAVYSRSVGLQGLALNANFGYDYHDKNADLNREHLDFSAVGNVAVGALCSVGGQAGYNRAQSALDTLTVDVTQNTIQTYSISGSENCRTGGGLTESVQLSHTSTQNSSSGLVDYDINTVSGLLGYTNPTIGTVGLTLSYDRTNYGSDPLAGTPDVMDVSSIGVQLSRPIGARLTGSVAVGWSHSADRAVIPALLGVRRYFEFSGLRPSSVSLSYLVGPRLRLQHPRGARRVKATLLRGLAIRLVTSADLKWG